MENKCECCSDCEVFKNHEEKTKIFSFGLYCPIANTFTMRDNIACEWIVSDNLPF